MTISPLDGEPGKEGGLISCKNIHEYYANIVQPSTRISGTLENRLVSEKKKGGNANNESESSSEEGRKSSRSIQSQEDTEMIRIPIRDR